MDISHPYLPVTKEIEEKMLSSIGKKSLEDLFNNIPSEFRLKRDLDITDTHSEIEVSRRLSELSEKNKPANTGRVFLGAGVGLHYIPSVVPSLSGRSEFLTSYTSYQPEISQGMLQTLFEYQSMMAEMLDIDVVNSSMYDMATALGEAAKMTTRVGKRRMKFLVAGTTNSVHLRTLHTYAEPVGIEVEIIDFDKKTGLMSLTDLEVKLDDSVAGVYIENPSYLGFVETQVDTINELVHGAGALLVVGVNILSLGVLRPPGNYGADIVIGEGHILGSPVTYGGPLLGVFGCVDNMKLIRQMPGRLVGLTRTSDEPYERGFVLTLSPREQHIRREKATSNICSNQAIAAVTAAVYLSSLGPKGIRQVSESIAYRANYAAKRLNTIKGVTAPAIGTSIWNEFVVHFENGVTAEHIHRGLLERELHGGKILSKEFPELGEAILFSFSEIHTQDVIEELKETLEEIVSTGGAQQ